jgi:hypothetical protein
VGFSGLWAEWWLADSDRLVPLSCGRVLRDPREFHLGEPCAPSRPRRSGCRMSEIVVFESGEVMWGGGIDVPSNLIRQRKNRHIYLLFLFCHNSCI